MGLPRKIGKKPARRGDLGNYRSDHSQGPQQPGRRRDEKKTTLEKVHNAALESEPFILEADLAARSSNQEKGPGQVREGAFGG